MEFGVLRREKGGRKVSDQAARRDKDVEAAASSPSQVGKLGQSVWSSVDLSALPFQP